ncbi:hypothetical protein Tdes44962_MAKER01454 [Teratosphaeria destructans]|uniref:Uncharacterized protein n=1 Tax=Teratosphaeria destructans TaxID=418781 RepID=A0A9W7SZP8_9PEZI|nr:hypothetical protein Tdes44962_MAKER01454 [Teratosphaeria destructans]
MAESLIEDNRRAGDTEAADSPTCKASLTSSEDDASPASLATPPTSPSSTVSTPAFFTAPSTPTSEELTTASIDPRHAKVRGASIATAAGSTTNYLTTQHILPINSLSTATDPFDANGIVYAPSDNLRRERVLGALRNIVRMMGPDGAVRSGYIRPEEREARKWARREWERGQVERARQEQVEWEREQMKWEREQMKWEREQMDWERRERERVEWERLEFEMRVVEEKRWAQDGADKCQRQREE